MDSWNLIHASDLHFEPKAGSISFLRRIAETAPRDVPEIEIADKIAWVKFQNYIHHKDSDVGGVLIAGDLLASKIGDATQLPDGIEELKACANRFKGAEKPFYAILGNHDVRFLGNELLGKDDVGAREILKGKLGEFLLDHQPVPVTFPKAFRCGKWCGIRLIPLDATRHEMFAFGGLPLGEVANIEEEVREARNDGHAAIVLLHYPPITTFKDQQENNLHWLTMLKGGGRLIYELSRAGVDFVLHGHDHVTSVYSIKTPGTEFPTPISVLGSASTLINGKEHKAGFLKISFFKDGRVDALNYQFTGTTFGPQWPSHLGNGSEPIILRCSHPATKLDTRSDVVILSCDIVGFGKLDKSKQKKAIGSIWNYIAELPRGKKFANREGKEIELRPSSVQCLSDEFLLLFDRADEHFDSARSKRPLAAAQIAMDLIKVGKSCGFQLRAGLHVGNALMPPNLSYADHQHMRSVACGDDIITARILSRIGSGGYLVASESFRDAFDAALNSRSSGAENFKALSGRFKFVEGNSAGTGRYFLPRNGESILVFWAHPKFEDEKWSFASSASDHCALSLCRNTQYEKQSIVARILGISSHFAAEGNPMERRKILAYSKQLSADFAKDSPPAITYVAIVLSMGERADWISLLTEAQFPSGEVDAKWMDENSISDVMKGEHSLDTIWGKNLTGFTLKVQSELSDFGYYRAPLPHPEYITNSGLSGFIMRYRVEDSLDLVFGDYVVADLLGHNLEENAKCYIRITGDSSHQPIFLKEILHCSKNGLCAWPATSPEFSGASFRWQLPWAESKFFALKISKTK